MIRRGIFRSMENEIRNLGPQFQWHRKPAGWAGAPCPICGCEAKRLKAEHRALPADEAFRKRGLWEKRFKVCFGLDMAREVVS